MEPGWKNWLLRLENGMHLVSEIETLPKRYGTAILSTSCAVPVMILRTIDNSVMQRCITVLDISNVSSFYVYSFTFNEL